MRVNKAMLMIRLVNRITAERDYWKEKVEAQLEGKPCLSRMNDTSVVSIKSPV